MFTVSDLCLLFPQNRKFKTWIIECHIHRHIYVYIYLYLYLFLYLYLYKQRRERSWKSVRLNFIIHSVAHVKQILLCGVARQSHKIISFTCEKRYGRLVANDFKRIELKLQFRSLTVESWFNGIKLCGQSMQKIFWVSPVGVKLSSDLSDSRTYSF